MTTPHCQHGYEDVTFCLECVTQRALAAEAQVARLRAEFEMLHVPGDEGCSCSFHEVVAEIFSADPTGQRVAEEWRALTALYEWISAQYPTWMIKPDALGERLAAIEAARR